MSRTINPDDYGFVPAARISSERAGALPDFDTVDRLVTEKDWRGLSAFLATLPNAGDRRMASIVRVGDAAADDDRWLWEWMSHEPQNTTALAVYAESLIQVAWNARTSSSSDKVTRDQWTTFHRVLRNIPILCERASTIDPTDPAPWTSMLTAARGLQWPNDKFRKLWAETSAVAPHSFTASYRAWAYWRPRWFGSEELLRQFTEETVAAAPPGSTLTLLRIEELHDELRPEDADGRTAFYRAEAWNSALDAGIADAAACDPDHAKLPYLRHWLAYGLVAAGRNAEAIEQFRAVGGYCGAEPWTRWKDPAKKFCGSRAEAVLAWEDAGRPAR